MSLSRRLVLVLTLLLGTNSLAAQVTDSKPTTAAAELQLTLPPHCYAVIGQPLSIYYDNLILQQQPGPYRFEFQIGVDGKSLPIGKLEERCWTWTPEEPSHRTVPVLVRVYQRETNERLTSATTTLHVSPQDAGAARTVSLLIVGDSLTHGTIYPNELAKLLSQPANPQWQMLGTHRPATAAKGVAHEGYGGWTWEAFVSRYIEQPDPSKRLISSPFVFVDASGKPQLDMARYFDQHFQGKRPSVVTFLLGINDCFSAPSDDPTKIDERIDRVFAQADKLLAETRRVAPTADLGICLVPPPNVRQEAFTANYQDRYTRWGWKRIQHQLVQRQIKHFGNREAERIYLIPTELNVDPVDGYPTNNAVHPNAVGYRQIAESIYAWLKWRMADDGKTP